MPKTLADIGEDALLEEFAALNGGSALVPPGDDALVFPSNGQATVASVDAMVEGRDFRWDFASAEEVGFKACAAAMSDLAAMGARPSFVLSSISLPSDASAETVRELTAGVQRCAETNKAILGGGDLSGLPAGAPAQITITAVGTADPEKPIRRSGANVGDIICVSGTLGDSAAGLHILRTSESVRNDLVERHLLPTPRLELGQTLVGLGITSMIDISDGFALDLHRLLTASGVGGVTEYEALPRSEPMKLLPEDQQTDHVLFGGEDYELLFTAPPAARSELLKIKEVAIIGYVRQDKGVSLRRNNVETELPRKGWDHFQ